MQLRANLEFEQYKRVEYGITALVFLTVRLAKRRLKMRKAVVAGSFDPITNGHLDIIERSSEPF